MRSEYDGRIAAAVLLALFAGGSAYAGQPIVFSNGLKLDWQLNTNYTLSTRVQSRSSLLANDPGTNDGNNNFDKGALTANRFSALLDASLSKGDSGFVFSASTFYDDVYHRSNDNAGPVNKAGRVNKFTHGARRYHGGYSRILDAYGYTSFDLGSQSRATVRLGRHVVSWGEALFFPGISLAQGPADGTKTGIPGTETKDQLLPEDQLSLVLEVTPKWSVLGHAQFNFHETIAPAPGSYLSTSDGTGPGASCLQPYTTVAPIPAVGFPGYTGCSYGTRGSDIRPGKTGQWGIGTRYRISNQTELGLYYLNYNDRTPIPEVNAFTPGPFAASPVPQLRQLGGGSYRVRYFEDIKLLGATFSTMVGASTIVAGELSHKFGAPVLVSTAVAPGQIVPAPTRADVTQLNLNAFANLGRTFLADSTTLMAEVSAVNISSVERRKAVGADTLPASFAATLPSTNELFFTDKGLAVQAMLVLGYPAFSESWELSVPISYSHQLYGRTLLGGVGGQGDRRASIGATFTHKGNLQVGLNYLTYLGSASLDPVHFRPLVDRDQISLNVKYSF